METSISFIIKIGYVCLVVYLAIDVWRRTEKYEYKVYQRLFWVVGSITGFPLITVIFYSKH